MGSSTQQRSAPAPVNWALLSFVRFVLAMIVVASHHRIVGAPLSVYEGQFGSNAVMGFLLLSGFSIAASLERSPQGFYRRRLKRLAFTYYSCFALAVLVLCWMGPTLRFHDGAIRTMPLGGAGAATLGMALVGLSGLVTQTLPTFAPAWSLSLEVVYYALAPKLRFVAGRWIWSVALLSASCALLWPMPAFWQGAGATNLLRFVGFWIVGFWAYRFRDVPLRFALALGFSAIVPLWMASQSMGTASVCLLAPLALVLGERVTLGEPAKRIALYLGDLSYPLYLVHYPILCAWMLAGEFPGKFGVAVVLALLASALILKLERFFSAAKAPRAVRRSVWLEHPQAMSR